MNELSQIVQRGPSSRQVNEGVQNNCSVLAECSNVRITRCGKESVSSSQSEKTYQDIFLSFKKKCYRLFSFLKSATTPISDDRDQGALEYDSRNSRLDPNLKTIENWLDRFELPTILLELEESLERVKRNKISKESHEELSKLLDKKLLRLSLKFHPDHAGDHEWQSALNAIRKVLKILTVEFLRNTFIDYKYEYFSTLDISILVNENEINNTIQAVLYKISVLSETKRMNIIGEIRKFLIESEKCVESYFKGNKSDFDKYSDYALYHLQKNIEGYKKLENEYNILIEECSKENDSMTAVVQNVASESLRESEILRSLECVARLSFQGNFKIFPVQKATDEYYILPFIDYVNVLSVCNLLLQIKGSRFSSFTEELRLFTNAYITKSPTMNATEFMPIEGFLKMLPKMLEEIFQDLQKDYRVDAYNEGKSNRAEMYEKLLALAKSLEDLQEKGKKTSEERLNRYVMEREKCSESFVNYRQDTEENFKVGMTKQEKESEEDSHKLNSLLKEEETVEESYECKEELSEMSSTEEKWSIIESCEVAEEVVEDRINSAHL